MKRLQLSALALAVLGTAVPATAASTERAAGISFRAPVEFSTGASPSSDQFNRAAGDQAGQLLTRAPLSDSVSVGDFDGDGNPDVAQTNVIAGTVSVLLGDGRSGFATPTQHVVGAQPVHVVAGHLDEDTDLDLAVADFGSDDVAILRGDGAGGFAPALFLPVPTPRSVAIGSFNGDSLPDLAVASSPPAVTSPGTPPRPTAGGVALFVGSVGETFTLAQFLPTTADDEPVNAHAVAAADFDDDGDDDLAVGVGISTNAGDPQPGDTRLSGDDTLIFLNGPSAAPGLPFAIVPQQRIRVGAWPTAIAVADLDGSSTIDLAVVDAASGDVTTLLGAGDAQFSVKATNVTVGAIPRAVAVSDLDNDGVLDIVTANFTSSTVSVLAGRGDGRFDPAVEFWSGDATTGAAVGDFSGDGRDDVVVGRLRDDHLALLVNDSPQKGDGVRITRDIAYGGTPDDPFAAHRALDVYVPPRGTPSFSGGGRAYPVVLFAHGGAGISGDKSMVSYLMRSLALEGLVAVSVNYRLGPNLVAAQAQDVADAFGWTRKHIGSDAYGGDPANLFVSGHSGGGTAVAMFATDDLYADEQQHVRGLILAGVGAGQPGDTATLPPAMFLNGDEGVETAFQAGAATYAALYQDRGAEADDVVVTGRDHMTLLSDLALTGDPGRVALLDFIRAHLAPGRGATRPTAPAGPSGPAEPPRPPLPATGPSDAWWGLGVLMLGAAARLRPAAP